MAETFGQLWNRVLLYAPGTPVPLVQQFVKNAYQKALDMHYWSELVKEGQYRVKADYSTGTVALTNGVASATITGGAFTDMTNRTIRFSDAPEVYTITAVSGGSDEVATLDRAYIGPTDAAATFEISDFYIEFPSDLATLDDIRDINQNWRLRRQFHQQNYLDIIDARRAQHGSPAMYVPAPPRVTSAGVSYPRYEFWPRPPEAQRLVYRYYSTPTLSANSDILISMLKGEAVIAGALAELSMWPGAAERPNPFFSHDTHKLYSDLFEKQVQFSVLGDLDRAQHMLVYDDVNTGVPLDANWLQSHGIPF